MKSFIQHTFTVGVLLAGTTLAAQARTDGYVYNGYCHAVQGGTVIMASCSNDNVLCIGSVPGNDCAISGISGSTVEGPIPADAVPIMELVKSDRRIPAISKQVSRRVMADTSGDDTGGDNAPNSTTKQAHRRIPAITKVETRRVTRNGNDTGGGDAPTPTKVCEPPCGGVYVFQRLDPGPCKKPELIEIDEGTLTIRNPCSGIANPGGGVIPGAVNSTKMKPPPDRIPGATNSTHERR